MNLLCRSDNKRHGTTVQELRRAKDVGRDEWPITKASAFKLLVKRSNALNSNGQQPGNNNNRRNNPFRRGAQFLQTGSEDNSGLVPGTDGVIYHGKICYRCGKKGHIRPVCPEATGEYDFNFSQHLTSMLSKWWILLDTCSTCCVTNNANLLTDLHKCHPNDVMKVITNGGGKTFKEKGKLKLLPLDVHYNKESIN